MSGSYFSRPPSQHLRLDPKLANFLSTLDVRTFRRLLVEGSKRKLQSPLLPSQTGNHLVECRLKGLTSHFGGAPKEFLPLSS